MAHDASDSTAAARSARLERLASVADARELAASKAELRFDAERRYLQSGRSEFATEAELLGYIASVLPAVAYGRGLSGSIKRVGKYERITSEGDPAFSFGDPILDLITDDQGTLHLDGHRLDLRAVELARRGRGGGLSCIDFSPFVSGMRDAQLAASLDESGLFAIVECTKDSVSIVSRNPHQQWFYAGTTKMRFRAFRSSYIVYTKIGADIETWGHDFASASIHSRYGRFLDETHGHCFTIHSDSDSDRDDDYVDEYEWFVGGGVGSGYDGVTSTCVASWHDRPYTGVVANGCLVVEA
jgi:hypothetical protein